MNRFHWIALSLAVLLTACSASAPNASSEGGEGRETEEHGEHEEAPQQTTIAAKTAQTAGIRVAPVGPGVIADEHEVQGLLTPVEGRVAQVTARFPGPVRSVRAGVGDHVRAGRVLATTWNLPTDIVDAIAAHHEPDGFGSEIGNLSHVSECLSLALDLGELPSNRVPDLSELACANLGLSWPKLATHFAEIEARFDDFRVSLGI